ncbi:EF-hand calcium-binding domain-containing protein 10-like isoform X1 [Poecile atricapillus]|uniref:EF-hand calcium-binding domain-containing protein 10-like isoform X1 n=1 Tax=Poecile atricapillus TaxID=48891 RepID=UPI0027383FED|nr:EF-hand calcium-binding domain-containing protein 10-like isoform X1 [Poecile atricapillus]
MATAEEQSREYLRRHRLPELLHRLGALLLFHRPERPREFLIQVLERVKAGRRAEGEYPFLMDEANVDAMFSLLDVLGQGHIRPVQYREAAHRTWNLGKLRVTCGCFLHRTLKTLGLSTEDLELDDDMLITLDVFKKGMKKKMLESWSVY